jgi:tRNA U34 5-methylaminomethyl-2-thiouridine-forming methyltransferase MnmC
MNREIFLTADGSSSVTIPSMNVTYHSRHGAIGESRHVFIDAGFLYLHKRSPGKDEYYIFEMGFGTGLNALLTLTEAERLGCKVVYVTIEQFPLEQDIFTRLNYCAHSERPGLQNAFLQMHTCEWEKEISITPFFTIKKLKTSLAGFAATERYDLVYYDAFAPAAQPELWTKEIFEKLNQVLARGGLLVTYCSKGEVQRAMKAAGFTVEKIPGPPGKREMIRAHYSNV